MGAYDNPKIIQPVNYAAIFNASAQNITDAFNEYMKDDIKKTAQAKALIKESDAKVMQFGDKAMQLNETSFVGSVSTIASGTTEQYADLERKRLRGEISNTEYNQKVTALYGKINEVKGVAEAFEAFEKDLPEDLSAFQDKGGRLLGLLEAKRKGELNAFYDADGKLKFSYKDADGEPKYLGANELANAETQFINTKFDAQADVVAAVNIIKAAKIKTTNTRTETITLEEGGTQQKTTGRLERWADETFDTEQKRIDYLKTNPASTISDTNIFEAGSYAIDTVIGGGQNILENEAFKQSIANSDLDDTSKENLKNALKNGQLPRKVLNAKGEPVNTDGIIIDFAKTDMAINAVKQAGDIFGVSKTVIDKTTNAADRARSASDREIIDLTKQTYEKLFTATYKAEAAGGDTKALGNLLIGVDIPGIGEVAPDLTEEGIIYNAKDNTLQLPIKEGDDIVMRTVNLKDEGEEKIVNAILKRKGVKNIGKASALLPGIISEIDPNNERFMDENPNPEDFN